MGHLRRPAMSVVRSLSGNKRTCRGHRVFGDMEVIRGGRCRKWLGTAEKLGDPPRVFCALRPRTQSRGRRCVTASEIYT